jgi:hypothetical protein
MAAENTNASFLNGVPISTTLPINGQGLVYDSVTGKYKPTTGNSSTQIVINSQSDFPNQDATTITLGDGLYLLNSQVVVSKRFIIPTNAIVYFRGEDAYRCGLTYTGIGNMFTGSDFLSFSFIEMLLSCPSATLYNIQAVSLNSASVFFIRSIVLNCVSLGILKNIDNYSMDFSAFFDIGTGLVFDGVRVIFLLNSQVNSWKNQSTSMITIQGTMEQFTAIGFITKPKSNEKVFDFKSTLVIDTGAVNASHIDLSQGGSVFNSGSQNYKNIAWKFSGNKNIQDSSIDGNMKSATTRTVVIATAGVPVIMNDASTGGTNIWQLVGSERFSFSASLGRLTYTGQEIITAHVFATSTAEKVGGGSDTIASFIAKNGTVLAESKSITNNSTPTGLVSIATTTISTGDYLSFAVQNDSSGADIIVSVSNFLII